MFSSPQARVSEQYQYRELGRNGQKDATGIVRNSDGSLLPLPTHAKLGWREIYRVERGLG